MTNYNPQSGKITADGRQSLIPGAAATEGALEAARSGAEERAKLQAQTAPAGSVPPANGATPPPAKGAQPQQPLQGLSAMQQEGYIPPVLAAPSNIQQRPGNTSLSQLQVFQKEQSEEASKDLGELKDQATSAQQLVTQAEQIEAAARDFTPGRYAEAKGEILAALQPTGVLSPEQLRSLGSYQEGQKLTIQLQAMVTKQLGSREAAQVFSVMGKSIPGLTLSPDGLGKIAAYLKGIARYQMAQNTFGQRLAAQGNVAGVNSLQSNYQTYSNPVYYILASAPPDVAKELIANMSPDQRPKVQAGWKKAISLGLAPAPGEYE